LPNPRIGLEILSKGHLGFTVKSVILKLDDTYFSKPRKAIIAALSVQYLAGTVKKLKLFSIAICSSSVLIFSFAATPPTTAKLL
jgi:hypothetical protein